VPGARSPRTRRAPDYRTAVALAAPQALNAAITAITEERDSAEWIDRFNKAGVPAGPIYAIDQVFADPQASISGLPNRSSIPRWAASSWSVRRCR